MKKKDSTDYIGMSGLVKPQPPSDLWQQLDSALAEHCPPAGRPPDTFTASELAAHAGYSDTTARARLRKLLKAGKVERVGQWWRMVVK